MKPEHADLDAYVRAANYLTVGQIYLQDNPLLREPLRPEHVKARLLGHWGTSPGLNVLFAHLNRFIVRDDLNVLFMAGPGHGGPAVVANAYLEGTYSEIYPHITRDEAGLRRLFRQFSTPGGIPSHAGPHTPGSIHEGGELGYVLSHAFGAAFDQPDLIVAAVVGDGEAETGPLEGAWKGISFLNPIHDGAVLPILHLNGYKIAGPTVLGRSSDENIARLLSGHGYDVHFVSGSEPALVHADLERTFETCLACIRDIQQSARQAGSVRARPRWPAIVMRTPKGWTGPREVDGHPVEGTFRSHQVPVSDVRKNPQHLQILETWLKSYRPEELFDEQGAFISRLAALAPRGARRMSANPLANAGLDFQPLRIPAIVDYALPVPRPGAELHESTRQLGLLLRDVYRDNPKTFRLVCPDETSSNRLGAVFETQERCLVAPPQPGDERISPQGRVMEVLSEHNCQGWLEGYTLTGRHGLFATYEAFALIVASMATQHAKWLEACAELPWRAPVPSLNYLLTSTCWRNDHNGFSHQGPGFMDTILSKKASVARAYLPPDANCLLIVADHCLRSKDHVNLIIIDKQPQLQWLDFESAQRHCEAGASIWEWAGTHTAQTPDVILACAGDTATQETMAAAAWLRQHAPELAVRVVNVVDLMSLATPDAHPHGMSIARFDELFTTHAQVVFAFHGYPGAVHQLLHGRPDPGRFHVRGYREEGTTTTPFDMVVLNETSRFHLVMLALQHARQKPAQHELLTRECRTALARHSEYVRAVFEDLARDSRLSLVGRGGVIETVLALNAGSSTLKYTLYRGDEHGQTRLFAETLKASDAGHLALLDAALEQARKRLGAEPSLVGHRIVHGGATFTKPVRVDDAVLQQLTELTPLAPLHLPPALDLVRGARARCPAALHVACFDTAFHQTLPDVARRFALPSSLHERGIRRYGFHGLSYEYVVSTFGALLPARLIVAHLGNGASMSAIRDGRSIDTSMGFTPAGGLPMGTRSGDLDPGVSIHWLRETGGSVAELEQLVNHQSGLLGVAGSSDMAELVARAQAGDATARAGIELFAYAVKKQLGAYTAALGGLDCLVFTGGIGEHAPLVRELSCQGLAALGIEIDAERNAANADLISLDFAPCQVRVIPTDEDLVIARAACAVAGDKPHP